MMFHENQGSAEVESTETVDRRRRISMVLLGLFTAVYAVFIFLCAFSYSSFSKLLLWDVPAPVWYGLGLIILAIGIAGIYGRLTRIVR
jgi:uncharacterized membrane protein (DUF485 family)